MEQLNGFDAFMIASELQRAPFHIAHFRIYDPSTSPDPVVRFKDILNCFEKRLHLAPLFRKQLVQVPLNLDNPYWIESPDFNIETHVRHIGLPKPGDWRQLRILLARLHSQPLNMNRPLWEAYVIEGLDTVEGAPEGAFGVLIKMHHSIVDGMAADAMLEAIHDTEPTPKKIKESFWRPEPIPANVQLLANTLGNYIKQPVKSFDRLQKLARSIRRGKEYEQEHPDRNIKQQELSIFNRAVSANKVFGAIVVDLDDLKTIKNSIKKATINDVSLAISSYAVEKYLKHHDKMVNETLKVGFAVNTRPISDYSDGYNNATAIFQSAHDDIQDPRERLEAIHRSSDKAKEHLEVIGPDRMRNVFDAVPGAALSLSFYLAGRYELMADQIVGAHYALSNVPGPREPRYLAGAKTICSFGLGPLMDSQGLIHVVSSYCDKLSVSFTSCRDMMPDPEFYEQCLYEAFDTMLAAAQKNDSDK